MSSFHHEIRVALEKYEENRGWLTRLLGFFKVPGFARAPAINALRKLDLNSNSENKAKEFQVLQCFFANKMNKLNSIWRVFGVFERRELRRIIQLRQSSMTTVFPFIEEKTNQLKLIGVLDQLCQNKLLNEENLNILKAEMVRDPVYLKNIPSMLFLLNGAGLLNQESFDAVKTNAQLVWMDFILHKLDTAHLLTQANINAVKVHADHKSIASVLEVLYRHDLLTQTNFDIIKVHAEPSEMASLLLVLEPIKHLITQEDMDALRAHTDPSALAPVLRILAGANLITQENRDAIIAHTDPSKLASALEFLYRHDLLTQTNFDIIKVHAEPFEMASLLLVLEPIKDLFSQENRDAIIAHTNPFGLDSTLRILARANLITPENRDAIIAHTNPSGLASMLYVLSFGFLTQPNFSRVLNLDNIALGAVCRALHNLPIHLFTQTVLDQLLEYAEQPNPGAQILAYVDRLLNENGERQLDGNRINNAQSTHTASVHASVSDSAKKLWDRYKSKLSGGGLKAIMATIKGEVSRLPDSPENTAAKRCIIRITNSKDGYASFVDRTSNVTTKQLIALVYLAINDDKNRVGSVEDAKKQMFDGLYEIQRGYNLSEDGVDDGLKDNPICTAGTFNKLMEKLNGIHTDVELIFITKQFATNKLPIVVKEEVKKYLDKHLANAEASNVFDSFITLMGDLEKEGIDIIWDEIKSQVTDGMFDEFKSLYANNKEHVEFKDLIEAGRDTGLENLVTDYRQKLESSSVYREHSSQMKKQSQGHSLGFFNQEASSEDSLTSSQPALSSSSLNPNRKVE